MTDDNKSHEYKTINSDTKEKMPRKKRAVTAFKKIRNIEKAEAELEEKLRDIKKEKKANELEYNKKLYFLIGKAIWEDLEDTREIDEAEYHTQLNQLKLILKSKIKSKADISFLNLKKLMEC